jgi:hypothetical protein
MSFEGQTKILWDSVLRYNKEEMDKKQEWDAENKDFKLKLLDVVRTKMGTLAVVAKLNHAGEASIAFSDDKAAPEKVAWYHPSELKVIGNVVNFVEGN